MADMRLLAAERNLANAEKLGQSDRAKRIQKRIKQWEKAAKAAEDLGESNVADLRELATEADIKGRSSMSKEELVEALVEEK